MAGHVVASNWSDEGTIAGLAAGATYSSATKTPPTYNGSFPTHLDIAIASMTGTAVSGQTLTVYLRPAVDTGGTTLVGQTTEQLERVLPLIAGASPPAVIAERIPVPSGNFVVDVANSSGGGTISGTLRFRYTTLVA